MKTFLLKSFLIISVSISISNLSFSQDSVKKSSDSAKTKDETSNSLKAKEWAIMFAIGADFKLTNFNDATIAVKYQISQKSALRIDFDVNYYNSSKHIYNESGSLSGNFSYLYYLNPNEKFNVYFNLGIKLRINDGYPQNIDSTWNSWLLGPRIGAGAEYFVFRKMSLFAEYNYFFGFGEMKVYQKIRFGSKKYILTSFSKDNVKFGLSVYF